MKRRQYLRSPIAFLALLASISMLLPAAQLLAEDTLPPKTRVITDVALGVDGSLQGSIVDASGNPMPSASLEIKSGNTPLVKTFSAKDGTFKINALRGGVYEITANGHTSFARLWAEQTAPPHAETVATLVGDSVVRGQSCGSECQCHTCRAAYLAGGNGNSAPLAFLLNPIVIGAAATAAIAIPLAIDDGDNDGDTPVGPIDPAS